MGRKFLALFLILCICKCCYSIFGGVKTRISEHPYQVSIRDKRERDHICGGVIYSPIMIITAAHCVASRPKHFLRIRAGTKDRKNDGIIKTVKDVIIKPNFNALTRSNDIALLILKRPLPITQAVAPVPNISDPYDVQNATFTGWGFNNEATQVLKEVSLPVLSYIKCLEYVNITQGSFCAGSPDATLGPCSGDNGGPLISNKQGEKALIGILSFNPKGCAEIGNPSVFTDVFHYFDWIKANEPKI